MRDYSADKYTELVENTPDPTLKQFMLDEQEFIEGIADVGTRTLVDLGAGNGRAIPYLANVAREVVAIELNPEMYPELERRSSNFNNVRAIQGDFLELGKILPKNVHIPVFLILQNSLGTIEGGESLYALEIVKSEASRIGGSIVLSLFRQPALKDWGVGMYGTLTDMVGNVDVAKSNFDKGLLITDTGYTSKWWTDSDIIKLKESGTVVRELLADGYQLIELVV